MSFLALVFACSMECSAHHLLSVTSGDACMSDSPASVPALPASQSHCKLLLAHQLRLLVLEVNEGS